MDPCGRLLGKVLVDVFRSCSILHEDTGAGQSDDGPPREHLVVQTPVRWFLRGNGEDDG